MKIKKYTLSLNNIKHNLNLNKLIIIKLLVWKNIKLKLFWGKKLSPYH